MDANKNSDDILSYNEKLKDNNLFKNLDVPAAEFENLNYSIINLKKGEILFRRGDSAHSIYLVIDGEIMLIHNQGEEKRDLCLFKNDAFGLEETFTQINRNTIAIAIKDSSIAEVSGENFKIFLNRHNSILLNLKSSLPHLDLTLLSKSENIIQGNKESVNKLPTLSKTDPDTNNNEKYMHSSAQDNRLVPESNLLYQFDLSKSEMDISKIIKSITDSLLLLNQKNSKVWAALSEYEKSYKKLAKEVVLLKEQNTKYLESDKNKNEVLGQQSYKIIQLEKDTAEFKVVNSEYLKKIGHLSEQESKNLTAIKNLEAELKNKEAIISKLDSDLKENNEYLNGLADVKLSLENKAGDQERTINVQKVELENLTRTVEALTLELSVKDKNLSEIEKELHNNHQIVSEHNNEISKAEAEKREFLSTLANNEDTIKNLSTKIVYLQSQLNDKEEGAKYNNEDRLILLNKISEYEELLKNNNEKLIQAEERIKKFTDEIRILSESVKQKEVEINEQHQINNQLNNDLISINTALMDAFEKRDDFEQKFLAVKSQLINDSNHPNSLPEDDQERIRLLELKEKEYLNLQIEYNELYNTIAKKESEIKDLCLLLEEQKEKISKSNKLREELDVQNAEFVTLSDANDRLTNENKNLLKQIDCFKIDIEKSNNELNNLLNNNAELSKLNEESKKYKNSLDEKDGIIKEQKQEVENLKLKNSEITKIITSTRENYEIIIKQKDKLIDELTSKYEYLEKSLNEKTFLENQHVDLIERQAQKIAEFELLVNESKGRDSNQIIAKKESGIKEGNHPAIAEQKIQPKVKDGAIPKFEFQSPQPVSPHILDNNFEHHEHRDVHIINMNLARATADMAMEFNEYLQDIISEENTKIVVSLLNCEFIDSSFLGVLVSNLKKITAIGGDLRLVGFNPAVLSMIELTRVNRLFESYPTIEEAISSFNQ
jgi:anti-anti-sigma factor